MSGKSNEMADIISREKIFANPCNYPDITQCFIFQMLGRGRGRSYQGRGRMSPYQSNLQFEQYYQAQHEQYLQFLEYQKKNEPISY